MTITPIEANKKQQALFPDLPRGKIINKEGDMMPEWRFFFDQLILSMQSILKPEGYQIPQLTDTQQASLTGSKSLNNIVVSKGSTQTLLKINIEGTWYTILTA